MELEQKAKVRQLYTTHRSSTTHAWDELMNDLADKIKPDVAGYGRHAGTLGYAGQGAKGNGI